MASEPIISVTTDGFAALLSDLFGAPPSLQKVVLLAQNPGRVVTHILQREGYQVHVGFGLQVVAEALAANPDLIIIEPQLLEQLIRAAGGKLP